MCDVGVVKASWQRQSIDRRTLLGANTNEQSVDRIRVQEVADNVWTDPAERVVKAVGVGGDRRIGIAMNVIEADRWPGIFQMNRGKDQLF